MFSCKPKSAVVYRISAQLSDAPLSMLTSPTRIGRVKRDTARDKRGTARDKTGTARDKTGTANDKTGTGHNWTNAHGLLI